MKINTMQPRATNKITKVQPKPKVWPFPLVLLKPSIKPPKFNLDNFDKALF